MGNTIPIDLALWLAPSDNLHMMNWYGKWGAEAEVSSYFMPGEWWEQLGASGIIREMQQIFISFLKALDSYL